MIDPWVVCSDSDYGTYFYLFDSEEKAYQYAYELSWTDSGKPFHANMGLEQLKNAVYEHNDRFGREHNLMIHVDIASTEHLHK